MIAVITVFNGLASPILYMLLFIAAGFVLGRLKLLPENAALVLSKLESYLFIPAMILNAFIHNCTWASIRANYPAMLLSAALEMVLIIISRPLSGLFARSGYERNLYRYELIYPNTGFFGYALVQAVFGPEMLYHFMLFVLPMTMGCYTVGVSLLTPEADGAKAQWKRLLNPSMISIAAGIVLGLLGFGKIMPAFLSDAVAAGAAIFSPLAMLLTGITISGFVMKDLLCDGKSYLVILLRMIVFPVLLVGLAWLSGADDRTLIFALFVHALPLGLNPVIYPPQYGKDARPGASMALISTVLSLITLPLFYALLLKLLGALPTA